MTVQGMMCVTPIGLGLGLGVTASASSELTKLWHTGKCRSVINEQGQFLVHLGRIGRSGCFIFGAKTLLLNYVIRWWSGASESWSILHFTWEAKQAADTQLQSRCDRVKQVSNYQIGKFERLICREARGRVQLCWISAATLNPITWGRPSIYQHTLLHTNQ